jgi:hypothetical protein
MGSRFDIFHLRSDVVYRCFARDLEQITPRTPNRERRTEPEHEHELRSENGEG